MVRNKVYGSEVREFEAMLSEHFDNSHTIAVNNATIGILGVLYSLGIQNSEIISTPFTWPGALTPFIMLNNKVIYGSIEEPTLTLNPDTLESIITSKTKVVFTADFLGYPCRLDNIKKICDRHNLLLIHDAASSMGTLYKEKYSGYFADLAIYSFGRNKPFTTGEGGVILTKNKSFYEKLIMNISHPERQDIEIDAYNPFSMNTSLNPLSVKYGLQTFQQQLDKINLNRENVIEKLSINNINNDYLPNYHKPIIQFKDDKHNQYNLLNLPFENLKYDTNINLFNCYKIVKELCLI